MPYLFEFVFGQNVTELNPAPRSGHQIFTPVSRPL